MSPRSAIALTNRTCVSGESLRELGGKLPGRGLAFGVGANLVEGGGANFLVLIAQQADDQRDQFAIGFLGQRDDRGALQNQAAQTKTPSNERLHFIVPHSS